MLRSYPSAIFSRRLLALSLCLATLPVLDLQARKDSPGEGAGGLTKQKITLMASVLSCRDAGEYERAIEKLDTLLALVGQDAELLRLRASLLELKAVPVAQRGKAPTPTIIPDPRAQAASSSLAAAIPQAPRPQLPPPEELEPAPVGTLSLDPTTEVGGRLELLVAEESARQEHLIRKARSDLWYARRLGDEGRYVEALSHLQRVGTGLPVNTLTLPVLQDLAAIRIDLEHRKRVASLNPGATPSVLSLEKEEAPVRTRSADPTSRAPLQYELHMLELSGDLIEDFWGAWSHFKDETKLRGPVRIHQSIFGRTHSLFRPGQTPNARQQQLLTAFRYASTAGSAFVPPGLSNRSLGFVSYLDAGSIVRILSVMDGCQVLGSPTWDCLPGQAARLSLTPDETAAGPEDIGWRIRVRGHLADEGRSVQLDLTPRITRQAGVVPSSSTASQLSPVYASHELSTQVKIPLGATLVLTGLEWQETPTKAPEPGSMAVLPVVGDMLRVRRFLAARSQLLVLLTTKPKP